MALESTPEIDYRVTLRNSTAREEVVIFAATPDLIETRNVNYKTIEPVHAPGQIMAYAQTSSRNFNLSNVRLISRTRAEAARNLRMLWLLRGWTMPNFGLTNLDEGNRQARETALQKQAYINKAAANPSSGILGAARAEKSSRNQADIRNLTGEFGNETRGAPPAVLLLSAYSKESSYGSQQAEHINRVPVVIQNMSIPYPSDVDYIPAEDSNVPMPTVMALDMTLMETHAPREYETFSLSNFKSGTLKGF